MADSISDRMVTYAVADIHGRLDLLLALLDLIEADAAMREARAKIVFTGDYLDRGADSYGVVERLMAGPDRAGDTFLCLRGNHDDLFVRSVTTGTDVPDWAWFLFDHTLQSYYRAQDGREMHARLRRHVDFITGLPLTHDDGRHLFVHAGLRPGVSLADQEEEDLLWIREPFLDHDGPLPRRVVHGHTIIGDSPIFKHNRISADTGAYRSGILTAIVLDGEEAGFIQAVGQPDDAAIAREIFLHDVVLRGHPPATLDRTPWLLRSPVRQALTET